MAGVKGMTGLNLGGARKGAGRKKMTDEQKLTARKAREAAKANKALGTNLIPFKDEIISQYETYLRSFREKFIADHMAQLQCDVNEFMALKEAGFLPPGFYEVEASWNKAVTQLEVIKALPAPKPEVLLLMIAKTGAVAR